MRQGPCWGQGLGKWEWKHGSFWKRVALALTVDTVENVLRREFTQSLENRHYFQTHKQCFYFILFYYSYVHTRLGSFLPPTSNVLTTDLNKLQNLKVAHTSFLLIPVSWTFRCKDHFEILPGAGM
jgi:hypothetical protein